MSKRLTGLNPLAYLGVEASMPPNMFIASVSPTKSDSRNFNLGDMWINTTSDVLYVLVSLAQGVALWVPTTGNSSNSFVTNSGTAVPIAGSLNVIGDGVSISTSAPGSSNTVQITATGSFSAPVTVPSGGTGDGSFTPYAVICGGTTSTNPLQSVSSVGTSGQILTSNGAGALPTFQTSGGAGGAVTFDTDGSAATASSNTITFHGAGGITTSGMGSTITITGSGSGSVTWNTITGTSSGLLANNGYITNNASLVTLTLPATAAVGATIYVTGLGAGGWTIAQNSGQLIHFGSAVTTTGVGGSLSSTNQYNTITLVCTVVNTTFNVLASIGNITVV
jgi:hypothetical protein